MVQRQPELQNQPGAEWNYNNTAFALLAMVVSRVTDTPFPEWMAENVFEPLGMTRTVVRASPFDLSGAMGAGAIYTTAGDLARWAANLQSGEVGGRSLIDAMTTPYVLTTGDTTDYGLGLFIDEYRGARRIHHGGADAAHRAMLAHFPDSRTTIFTLSNNAAFSGAIAGQVAEAFLGDALAPRGDEAPVEAAEGMVVEEAVASEAAPFDPATYDTAAFDDIAGQYSLDAMPSFILTFFREGDTLYTQATGQPRVRITPTSDSSFTLVGVTASVTFHRDDDGHVTHATLHQNGEHRATRIEGDRWEPSRTELQEFTGRFYSQELETFYTVELEGDDLVVKHRRFEDGITLQPGQEDTFSGSFPIAELEFLRDVDGAVSALLVSNGRARGIRFERAEARRDR